MAVNNQTEQYLKMLFHDDYNSNYFLCQIGKGVKSKHVRVPYLLNNLNMINNVDSYISVNGFTGNRRLSSQCRQINCIFFDLDYHKPISQHEMDWIINHNLIAIQDAITGGDLSEPNIIVNTGRGLHIYYILRNSISCLCSDGSENQKALYLYNLTRDSIASKIVSILPKDNHLDFDSNVFDKSRIVRIPGTYNSKSGKRANIVYCNEDYYDFKDLIHIQKTEKTKPVQADNKDKTKSSKRAYSTTALQALRIKELDQLLALRNYNIEGHRYHFTFLYYNALIQLYPTTEADKLLDSFVSKFRSETSDFSESEINAIKRAVVKNVSTDKQYSGHYMITQKWIIDTLAITTDEMEEIGMNKSVSFKREETKIKNKMKKDERNKAILNMAAQNIKHSDIAAQLHISLRTVQNVLKENNLTRGYNYNNLISNIECAA